MSDSASLEPVYEQQERMGTTPETLLADTACGSQAHVEKSAEAGVTLISPVAGKAVEITEPTAQPTPGQEKKAELNRRRAEQETEEWKREYRKRSGVEGVHEALDRKTGIKKLKVRGMKAVAMAVFLKVTGWNIFAAAKIALKRRKKGQKGTAQKNSTLHAPQMRRLPAEIHRRRATGTPIAKFSTPRREFFARTPYREISLLRPHLV